MEGDRALRQRADRREAGEPGERGAEPDGDEAAGQAAVEPHPAEVDQHHDAQGGQPDDRPGEGPEQEAERDEAEGDAGQRREQRGARRRLADPLGDERAGELDQPRADAGDEPGLPGDGGRVGAPAASAASFAGSMTRKT